MGTTRSLEGYANGKLTFYGGGGGRAKKRGYFGLISHGVVDPKASDVRLPECE